MPYTIHSWLNLGGLGHMFRMTLPSVRLWLYWATEKQLSVKSVWPSTDSLGALYHWQFCREALCINSSPSGQNSRCFTDDISDAFSWWKKKLIKISLKFVPKGPIDDNPAFGSDSCLTTNRQQAIMWTNAHPIHWRKWAALGGDELKDISCHCWNI